MESKERLWLLLQLQAHSHGRQQGGWGKAAASQKRAMGAGLHSLSLSVKAMSPDRRFVTPSILMQCSESRLLSFVILQYGSLLVPSESPS